MWNGQRPPAAAEVMDRVVFRPRKSMKPDGLPAHCRVYRVFPTETYVLRWKLLARDVAEAYDGRNVSPNPEE